MALGEVLLARAGEVCVLIIVGPMKKKNGESSRIADLQQARALLGLPPMSDEALVEAMVASGEGVIEEMIAQSVALADAIQVRRHPDGGFVISLGSLGGPEWGGLLEFVVETDPRVDYAMDSEGRGWSATAEPLERLRAILIEAAAAPQKLRELIRNARAAGYGY